MISTARICGKASTRARIAAGSTMSMFVPSGRSAVATISSADTRVAPSTWMVRTARRGVVSSHAALPTPIASTSVMPPNHAAQRTRRKRRRRRRRARPIRCRLASGARRPTLASAPAVPCGATRCLRLFTDDPYVGLQKHVKLALHPLAGELQQAQDIAGGRAASVDDEVRVLGGDLRPSHALAPQTDLLDELACQLAGGVLPHEPGRCQRERLGGLLSLEALLEVTM